MKERVDGRGVIGGFTFDAAVTPRITSVKPNRGGTAGGTRITIDGANFSGHRDRVSVSILGSECAVKSSSNTRIICETSALARGVSQVAVTPDVTISGGGGKAISESDEATFWYIDRWSSPYTWGCDNDSCKPQEGEIVVIDAGQTLLLDETTPKLAVLLIDGGTVLWDHKDGIELHTQYAVINNGGHFEIGTEERPFCAGKALIKMYGHQRSINLPIYGAKVFAVRFGTFDIHGCPVETTWTDLEVTAKAGDTSIQLIKAVNTPGWNGRLWQKDDKIVIAATGDITAFPPKRSRRH